SIAANAPAGPVMAGAMRCTVLMQVSMPACAVSNSSALRGGGAGAAG
ncbi:MAG: hypothetical protein JWQ73_4386, partial [Variovorax sp.]|nr:hypothetical protein [Variovorax sp.]